MRTTNLLILLFPTLFLSLVACQKNKPMTLGTPSVTLVAKWQLVNDTLANINNYFVPAGYPVPGNYIGVPGDYWEFHSDGTVNWHGNRMDYASTYQLVNNHLIVAQKTEFKYATLENLTAHTLTIYGSDTSSNGGIVFETVNLSR